MRREALQIGDPTTSTSFAIEILLSLTAMVAMLSMTIEHSLTLSPTPPPVTALIITFVHSLSYSLHYSGLYVFVFLLVGEYTSSLVSCVLNSVLLVFV